MAWLRFGGVFAVQILLFSWATLSAHANFLVREDRLLHRGDPFSIRGVVYTPVPIGQTPSDPAKLSGCLYARDFPLIAGLGANTLRTLTRVDPGDHAFQAALEASDLYWLAGFPLDRFYDPQRSLSSGTASGQALRREILEEFRAYAAGWTGNAENRGRLIAFVFWRGCWGGVQAKVRGLRRRFLQFAGRGRGGADGTRPGTPCSSDDNRLGDDGDRRPGARHFRRRVAGVGFLVREPAGRRIF